MEIHPVGSTLIQADGWMDRHDKTIGAPLDYVNVPKIQPTRYTLYTYNDYLFQHSNMFWPNTHLQGYH